MLVLRYAKTLSGSNSVVECQLPKLNVAGSIPVSRSKTFCTVILRQTLFFENTPSRTEAWNLRLSCKWAAKVRDRLRCTLGSEHFLFALKFSGADSSASQDPAGIYDCRMQFILGVILFVVVIGVVDRGVPWPRCKAKETK